MKKGCLLGLILTGLVGFGLIYRYRFIMKDIVHSKEVRKIEENNKRIKARQLLIDNVYGKSLIDSGEIEPSIKWKNIILGKWQLLILEKYSKSFWTMKVDITFEPNNLFHLFINARKYWNETEKSSAPSSEDEAIIALGGGMQGEWKFTSDSTIQLTKKECEIFLIKGEGVSGDAICNYVEALSIGKLIGTSTETDIKAFNQNEILITGRNYASNSSLYYYFTRVR